MSEQDDGIHEVAEQAALLLAPQARTMAHARRTRARQCATADYLHEVFELAARAITGLERALEAVGLLDEAQALDLRRPQDYFGRV
ncbi:hypothetical protein [Streptomyces europaeiscabiei]|uniref:hypothetical protein n=1 Tax=Streptomyces europaeiscabiei TaxID=146819 RepID=UPI002E2B77A8|nr:hypothetical protein [Streptomyces europaeiscabiei]